MEKREDVTISLEKLEKAKLLFKLSESGKLNEFISHSRKKDWDTVKKLCKELHLSEQDCKCLYAAIMWYLYNIPPDFNW
jgi:hypothetical protein